MAVTSKHFYGSFYSNTSLFKAIKETVSTKNLQITGSLNSGGLQSAHILAYYCHCIFSFFHYFELYIFKAILNFVKIFRIFIFVSVSRKSDNVYVIIFPYFFFSMVDA